MLLRKKISRTVLYTLLCFALYLCGTVITHAQTPSNGFAPLQDIKDSDKLRDLYSTGTGGDLSGYINKIFFFAISLGGILAVIQLARAGWMYMGGDNWGKIGQAKEIIGNVVIGVLLLLSIYLILFQINPAILQLDVLKSLSS